MTKYYPAGAKISKHDPRDIRYASLLPMAAAPKPRKFSLRTMMSPVVMQNYGSCEGFTGKDLKEYQELKERGQLTLLSGRWAYAVAKLFDGYPNEEGTQTRSLLKGLAGYGISLETDFPNNPIAPTHAEYIKLPTDEAIHQKAMQYRISGFAICNSVDEVKAAILSGEPVIGIFNLYNTFDAAQNDGYIAKPPSSTYNRGMHAVLIIGWDDDFHGSGAWEIKNHWDVNWANQGYGFIAYDYEGQWLPWVEAWVTTDQIDSTSSVGAPLSLAYPVDNPVVITQHFGENPQNYAQFGLAGHEGVDFRAKNAAPIYAIDNGSVIFTGWKGGYGNCVIIQHSWGISLYAHLSKILVSDGGNAGLPPPVARRALLGRSGNTGHSTAEHLHLGGKINGVKNPPFKDWVNLEPYLGKTMNPVQFVHRAGTSEYGFLENTGYTVLYHRGTNEDDIKFQAKKFGVNVLNPDGTINFGLAKDITF